MDAKTGECSGGGGGVMAGGVGVVWRCGGVACAGEGGVVCGGGVMM